MPKYKATAYIRLSYTDDHSSESDSVSNQRKLIENFVERKSSFFADLSERSVYYLRTMLRATSCFSFNSGTDTVCFFHSSIEQVTALHRRHFVQPSVASRSTS